MNRQIAPLPSGAALRRKLRSDRSRRSLPLIAAASAAGLVGLGYWLTRGAMPKDGEAGYPPFDVPKPLAEDVWIVDSAPISAMGLVLPIRMTVIRLANGDLLLHSPTRYSAELGEALAALGTVRHVVAPAVGHWMFLPDWQRAHPGASYWGVPALRKRTQVREAGVAIDGDLGEAAPPAWAGEIDQGIVRGGGGFEEAWFFHRPSGTLILTDLIENLEPAKLPPVTLAAMRAARATSGTTGLHVRAAVLAGGVQARAAIRTIAATAPTRVVFAHGRIFDEGAAGQLARALRWAT